MSEQPEQRHVPRPANGVNWAGVMSMVSQSGQTEVPCWNALLGGGVGWGYLQSLDFLLCTMLEISQQGMFLLVSDLQREWGCQVSCVLAVGRLILSGEPRWEAGGLLRSEVKEVMERLPPGPRN